MKRNDIHATGEMIDVTSALARIRDDLVVAVAADRRRVHRRRRSGIAAVAAAATLAAVGTSIAATSGLFPPAPAVVRDIFGDVATSSGVEPSKAVEIGVIDDHVAYAAPATDGGFCIHFADNPRSGPSGTACIPAGKPGEIVLNASLGTDGGFVFGRVTVHDATTVEVTVPHGGGTTSAVVQEEGFFLASLSDRALRALTVEIPRGPKAPQTKDGGPIRSFDIRRIDAITARARTADGRIVAAGVNAGLSDPGVPTTTTAG